MDTGAGHNPEMDFREDLAAALELKAYLIGQGIDLKENILSDLAELEHPSFVLPPPPQAADILNTSERRPLTQAERRVQLDRAVLHLTQEGDVLLDEFRPDIFERNRSTRRIIRRGCVSAGCAFLVLAFATLFLRILEPRLTTSIPVAFWAISMGGLGSVTSMIIAQTKGDTRRTYPPGAIYDAIGRIMLGILFSFAISTTAIHAEVSGLFENPPGSFGFWQSSMQLLPFVIGYSLPLALGILDKVVRAIAAAFGIDDKAYGAFNGSGEAPPRPSHGRGRAG